MYRMFISFFATLVAMNSACLAAVDLKEQRALVELNPSSEPTEFAYAQALYRNGESDALFGLTQWVRLRLWPTFSEVQKDRWLSLELTALARHCRWTEIDRLYAFEGLHLAMAGEAMSLIQMKKAYQSYLSDAQAKPKSLASKFESTRTNWAATADEFKHFTSPVQLTAHVESLCRD